MPSNRTDRARALLGALIVLAALVGVAGPWPQPMSRASAESFQGSGELDPSFGTNGVVVTDVENGLGGQAVVVGPDGKVLVAGNSGDAGIVLRYLPNGTLDSSFASGGIFRYSQPNQRVTLNDLVLHPDGSITAAGTTSADSLLLRVTSAGALDQSWADQGRRVLNLDATPDKSEGIVAFQRIADGAFLAAASTYFDTTSIDRYTTTVIRLTPAGEIDSSFGDQGRWTAPFWLHPADLAIDASQRILVAGAGDVGLSRLLPRGILDTAFASGGKYSDESFYRGGPTSVLVLPSGRIVIGGTYLNQGSEFMLIGLTPAGQLDRCFGYAGSTRTLFTEQDNTRYGELNDLEVTPDGRILAAGQDGPGFALARYRQNGAIDPSFGVDGKAQSGPDNGYRIADAAVMPDGRIVAAGNTGNALDVQVARYLDPPRPHLANPAHAAVFGGFAGGGSVAAGDLNGDGTDEVVVGAGRGGGPDVRAFAVDAATGGLTEVAHFFAYSAGFTGGVDVAVGDLTGDGRAEIITGAGAGGAPHVRVWRGDGSLLRNGFYAYGAGFTGGVDVGWLDLEGRGAILTGAGPGGGPHVRAFTLDGEATNGWFAYGTTFTGGVHMEGGDLDGEPGAEVITGAGPGGGPHVRIFRGDGLLLNNGYFAYGSTFGGGVRVASGDLDGNGCREILSSAGPGGGPHVASFTASGASRGAGFFAYDDGFRGGVDVAAADVDGDGIAEIATTPGPGRTLTVDLWPLPASM